MADQSGTSGLIADPTPDQMVAGLVAKRQEIAAQIEGLQRQVKTATAALDRVEATMRIFKPDLDLSQFPALPVPPAHSAFKGEITRIVFAALRAAPEPPTARDLAEIVMRERGLPVEDLKLLRVMQGRVGSMLNHWKRVKKVLAASRGPDGILRWTIEPAMQRPP